MATTSLGDGELRPLALVLIIDGVSGALGGDALDLAVEDGSDGPSSAPKDEAFSARSFEERCSTGASARLMDGGEDRVGFDTSGVIVVEAPAAEHRSCPSDS